MPRWPKRVCLDPCFRGMPQPMTGRDEIRTVWVVTDGKVGDIAQTCGVTDALGLEPQIRKIHPRAPWSWLAPRGPIDPREDFDRPDSPLKPPFPDLVVASGRRTVPYIRRIRALSPETFTVFLKDPRTGPDTAHLIWVPEHDPLRGETVVVTLTSPHRCGPDLMAAARARAYDLMPDLGGVRIGVILGGNSVNHKWPQGVIEDFVSRLSRLKAEGRSFYVTPSRRTPSALTRAVKEALEGSPHHVWDGVSENPYLSILAICDHFVVTADSVNMIGEALLTGKPVHTFEPHGGHPKFTHFLNALRDRGAIVPLDGELHEARYAPIDAIATIAGEIRRRYALWKAERTGAAQGR